MERILTDTTSAAETLHADTHRRLGMELYNEVWSLIELADRTPDQVDQMIALTHASAYHWARAGGTLANAARGDWQIARAYATLERGEPALWHADRCVQLAEAAAEAGVADDWDLPVALETLARAQTVAGDAAGARATQPRARAALERVADKEDRQQIAQDLDSLPT